jgi:hypothetical protein
VIVQATTQGKGARKYPAGAVYFAAGLIAGIVKWFRYRFTMAALANAIFKGPKIAAVITKLVVIDF